MRQKHVQGCTEGNDGICSSPLASPQASQEMHVCHAQAVWVQNESFSVHLASRNHFLQKNMHALAATGSFNISIRKAEDALGNNF